MVLTIKISLYWLPQNLIITIWPSLNLNPGYAPAWLRAALCGAALWDQWEGDMAKRRASSNLPSDGSSLANRIANIALWLGCWMLILQVFLFFS